uniref:MSP domain-containing protein n=1 Tax=Oryza punctata TaxID=4537 RepID=A0A0E0L1T6_ORYPU
MGSEDLGIVEIHPGEIRFEFEVKKKSSCSVCLVNKSEEYVAFKVKTTSPKRYCVRPNVGVILPRATFIMQAQIIAPPDLQIRDKFLVQTTVVPFGTADEDIAPAFFSKEAGRYIEENKLRVVLVSATQLEEQQLIAGVPSAKTGVEVRVAKETLNIESEASNAMNEVHHSLKTSFPPLRENPATLNEMPFPVKQTTILAPSKEVPAISAESAHHWKETPAESLFSRNAVHHSLKTSFPPLRENPATLNEMPFPVTDDVQNLMIKLSNLEVKLEEAESVIVKLRENTRTTISERDKLKHEMVVLTRKGASRSQAGFPLLFVVYMAILGVSLGYLLHL